MGIFDTKIDKKIQVSSKKRINIVKKKNVPVHERKWGRTALVPKTVKNRWKVKGR